VLPHHDFAVCLPAPFQRRDCVHHMRSGALAPRVLDSVTQPPDWAAKVARSRNPRRNSRASKSFLEEVADKRRAEKVFGGAFIVRTRSFFTHSRPITGGIIIPSQPRQGHEIDLLLFGE